MPPEIGEQEEVLIDFTSSIIYLLPYAVSTGHLHSVWLNGLGLFNSVNFFTLLLYILQPGGQGNGWKNYYNPLINSGRSMLGSFLDNKMLSCLSTLFLSSGMEPRIE